MDDAALAGRPQVRHVERLAPGISMARSETHRHDFHEAILLRTGSYTAHTATGRLGSLQPGDHLVYPAGQAHAGEFTIDGRTSFIVLQWTGPCPLTEPTLRQDPHGEVAALFSWMLRRVGNTGRPPADDVVCEHLLAAFVGSLAETPTRGCTDLLIDRLLDELARNMHLQIGLDFMCQHTGLSQPQLHRRFHAVTGEAPMRHLARLRLERAHHLLQTTGLRMPEIARQVGLRSAGHLGRQLKKYYGKSAPQIRRGSALPAGKSQG